MTVSVSDALAAKLIPLQNRLPEILERGVLACEIASMNEFSGVSELLELLASLPSPQQVLALRPSPALQARMRVLLDKAKETSLTSEEQREMESYEYLEHLVRIAKAQAAMKLSS